MNFKKVIIPVCAAVSLIILFVILHLALIGPIPVTCIRVDGWNSRTISREEIDAGSKDFSRDGNYIRSESGDPWLIFNGDMINGSHAMKYLYIY